MAQWYPYCTMPPRDTQKETALAWRVAAAHARRTEKDWQTWQGLLKSRQKNAKTWCESTKDLAGDVTNTGELNIEKL
ncbi:MAG TPA: hypothetical protein H9790_10120 [Candidatus Agathobaculum intestinipullorum]|nr:hypothetical protein [Candidatus Agathobaculum intestinipullorum]